MEKEGLLVKSKKNMVNFHQTTQRYYFSLLEPDDPERFFRNGSVDEIEAGSKVDFDQREDLDATDGYENANSDEDDSSQDGFNDQVQFEI